MPTVSPTNSPPVSYLIEEPTTPREVVVDAIALEAATGSTTAQLAARYGYTYGGMAALCQRDAFQLRVRYYQKRLDDMKLVAHRKVLLHLPNLLNNELAVGLCGEDPTTGVIDVEKASAPASQRARQYLIDKVLPTTTRVESSIETINAPETREVLTELRTVLRRINDERTTKPRDFSILDSSHVLEGTAALPSPLLEKQDIF